VISALVIATCACVALAFVAWPLKRERVATEPQDQQRLDLEARKTSALAAIIDLEDEVAVGKLSTTDFAHLKAQYESEAATVMSEIAHSETTLGDDDDLEREIAELRSRLACPTCGSIRPDPSCTECGSVS
jgi:hypothetical protein